VSVATFRAVYCRPGVAGDGRLPKFAVPSNYDPSSPFQKSPSPIDQRAMADINNYFIEADGYYFVAHLVDVGVATVTLSQPRNRAATRMNAGFAG
jgi:hypothetical protein